LGGGGRLAAARTADLFSFYPSPHPPSSIPTPVFQSLRTLQPGMRTGEAHRLSPICETVLRTLLKFFW